MEVVKVGERLDRVWPREMTCPECDSVLRVEVADINKHNDYTGDFCCWWVLCPICREQPEVPQDWWGSIHRLKREQETAG